MRKTMKQRWLSIIGIIVSVITIATLSACNNEQQDNSNPGQSSLSTTEATDSNAELSEGQSDSKESLDSPNSTSKEERESENSNSNAESEDVLQNEETAETTTKTVTTTIITTTTADTTTTEAPTTTTIVETTTVTTTTALSLPEHNGVVIPEDEYQLLVEGARNFRINNYEIIYSTEFIEGSLIVPSVEWYNSADEQENMLLQYWPELPKAENGYGTRQAWQVVHMDSYDKVSDILDDMEYQDVFASTVTENHFVMWRYAENIGEERYEGILYYSGGGKVLGLFYSGSTVVEPGWCLVPQ